MVASSNLVIPTNFTKTLDFNSVSKDSRVGGGTETGQEKKITYFLGGENSLLKKKMQSSQKKEIAKIIGYKLPKLTTGKEWFVSFYSFDPIEENLRRKKIKINHISTIGARRTFANELMKKITLKLIEGWSPWIEQENANAYKQFTEVCTHYKSMLKKQLQTDIIRQESFFSYCSYLKILEDYAININPVKYIYQVDRVFLLKFLEYVYVVRQNSAQTRDNYLGFLRIFANFLVEHQYLKNKPTDAISNFGKARHKKQRTIIPEEVRVSISNYLNNNNKYMLMACMFLYYCFIRPKEMALLQIENINIEKSTIIIPGVISKNRKTAVITIPKPLMQLILELKIMDNPPNFYIFSNNQQPGKEWRDEKQFRDYWNSRLKKQLKLLPEYKFYSLKDTGITDLLRNNVDVISVRDQARHHSIVITDTYTPHDVLTANEVIKSNDNFF